MVATISNSVTSSDQREYLRFCPEKYISIFIPTLSNLKNERVIIMVIDSRNMHDGHDGGDVCIYLTHHYHLS